MARRRTRTCCLQRFAPPRLDHGGRPSVTLVVQLAASAHRDAHVRAAAQLARYNVFACSRRTSLRSPDKALSVTAPTHSRAIYPAPATASSVLVEYLDLNPVVAVPQLNAGRLSVVGVVASGRP